MLSTLLDFSLGFLQLMQAIFEQVMQDRTLSYWAFGYITESPHEFPLSVLVNGQFHLITDSHDFYALYWNPIFSQGAGWAKFEYTANILQFMVAGLGVAFVGIFIWNIVKKVVASS